MNAKNKIPIWRNFTNWGITVILGSIVWPIVSLLFKDSSGYYIEIKEDILGNAFISIIASAICSLPALLILCLTIYFLNKEPIPLAKHQWIQNSIHIVVSIATFGVIGFLSDVSLKDIDSEILAIPFTYTTIGIITWNITYYLHRKKVKESIPTDNLLDE